MQALWLIAEPEELSARIVDKGRRLLRRDKPVCRQRGDLLARRTRAYTAGAHHIIDTSGRTVSEADEVVALWKPS